MKRLPDRGGPLHLILLANGTTAEPVGIEACPPHLPETVWRLPGEGPAQLVARALATAVGQGVVAARMLYPCDLPQPEPTRH